MELKVKSNGEKARVVLEFDRGEYAYFSDKFEALGLKKAHTEKGLGRGLSLDYYQSRENEILASIGNIGIAGIQLIDDINGSATCNGNTFNIAIFRIIPVDGKVEIPLSSYLTHVELKKLKKVFVAVAERIVGIVEEAEVHVEFASTSKKKSKEEVEI